MNFEAVREIKNIPEHLMKQHVFTHYFPTTTQKQHCPESDKEVEDIYLNLFIFSLIAH